MTYWLTNVRVKHFVQRDVYVFPDVTYVLIYIQHVVRLHIDLKKNYYCCTDVCIGRLWHIGLGFLKFQYNSDIKIQF